ncbi:hypothetical protein PHPALM_27818 [Phytophthora palmivora]|uniref:Uncharacterized protein n=1 Tax=Phytophthora palmivora TaxID=4796 RepID=A0A2P4XBN4_9STRA|nr:hypothetical protein PHPALM_27818 [Phytophthora palmivora]
MGRKQRGYSIKEKLAAAELIELVRLPSAVEELGYPPWHREKGNLSIHPDLVTFMRDTRRDEEIITNNGLKTILLPRNLKKMVAVPLRRTDARYVFSTQKSQETKLPSVDLIRTDTEFALNFWIKYNVYSPSKIYNVDETAIPFDMPTRRIWDIKGGQRLCQGKKLPILFILRAKLGGSLQSN